MIDPFALAECNVFNRKCPVGTRVSVEREDGTRFYAATRSQAWPLAGVCPVVMVTGELGMHTLNCVTKIAKMPD